MNLQILHELSNYIEINITPKPKVILSNTLFECQVPYDGLHTAAADKTKSTLNEEDQEAEKIFFQRFLKCKKSVESEQEACDSHAYFKKPQPINHKSGGIVKKDKDLEDFIRKEKTEETFSTRLLKYIDMTGLSDSEVYKRAGIDRRHFSKIRCDRDYKPKKSTAVALCLALNLDEGKTDEMLKLAGYSLSNSDTGDLVVKFCIGKGIFDLIEVNEALDYFGQKWIGV